MIVTERVNRPGRTPVADSERQTAQVLGNSEWWLQQRSYVRARRLQIERQDASFSASLGLVRCYVEVIVGYWEHLFASGQMDPDGHVGVLEWGAASGRFAYRLLQGLRERLAVSTLAGARVRYVACEEDRDAVQRMLEHPYLEPVLRSGELVVRHVTPNEEGAWRDTMRAALSRPGTPLVLIANDVFGAATQDLVAFQDGKMFDALALPSSESADAADAPLPDEAADTPDIEWTECRRIDEWPFPWQRLLTTYARRLDRVAVMIPTGALSFLDGCRQLTAGNYLLLATDLGMCAERHIRAGRYRYLEAEIPVNFDALSRYQRAHGALTWNSMAEAGGRVIHVALASSQDPGSDFFGAVVHRIQHWSPRDLESLRPWLGAVPENASCEDLLAAVRVSHEDPRTFASVIGHLLAKLDTLTVDCCMQWRETLGRIWCNYFPLYADATFALGVGAFAMCIGHWGVAREAFETALAMQGEDPVLLYRLSCCEAATGRVRRALELIGRARVMDAESDVYRQFEAALHARIEAWRTTAWFALDELADPELTLEPLGPEHADALVFQYRDPQISTMTRLPELDSRADVLAWLEEHAQEPGLAVYAVMHACWGFIGVVSMRSHANRSYFYFWIGADHQGAGLGCRAVELLFRQAQALGVNEIFTAAYPFNQRSCDSLRRLGFQQVDVAASPPDDDLVFFHRFVIDPGPNAVGAPGRLDGLLRAIDSPVRLDSLRR